MKTIIATLLFLGSVTCFAADMGEKIEATTASGDKVVLNPNGRWAYVDTKKASTAAKIAKKYPENQVCPPEAQGGWFGTRCIMPGDKAYNRRSRIGK